MRRLLFILLFYAMRGTSYAHVGFENDTEIRVFPDSMRVVIRTSIPFAQALLGDGSPLLTNEAGRNAAKPLLVKSAAELISITAGGKSFPASGSDCLFEVQDDVAFILNFPRPTEWPVVVKADFFPRFGNLETGTIAAFDCTASRFSREVEPLKRTIIDPRNSSFTFSLGTRDIAKEPEAIPSPDIAGKSSKWKNGAGIFLFLTAVATVVILVRRSWRDLSHKA